MKFLNVALATFCMMTFMQLEAKLDPKKIPGTYISEVFATTPNGSTQTNARSELLVLHADGTGARYSSTSIGSFAVSQNEGGIELTPSFGTWEIDCKDDSVKAVFFDHSNLPPCIPCVPSSCADSKPDSKPAIPKVVHLQPSKFRSNMTGFTYTLRFFDVKDCKYQLAVANEFLIGIFGIKLPKSCKPDYIFDGLSSKTENVQRSFPGSEIDTISDKE